MATFFTRTLERLTDAWNSAYFPLNMDRFLNRLASEFSAQNVYQVLQDAKDAAANGDIPESVNNILTSCHTTPGDGGTAWYERLWVQPTHNLWFRDLNGSYWALNERNPRAPMGGLFGEETGAEPTIDQSEKLNDLLDYVYERWGGGSVALEWRAYLCNNDVVMRDATGIVGQATSGRVFQSPGKEEGIEGLLFQPGLVLANNKQIKVAPMFLLEDLAVRRAGIEIHDDLEGALRFQAQGFQGTAVVKGGSGDVPSGTILNCAFYGFAYGFYLNKMPGLVVNTVYGDCSTLGLALNCGESIRLEGIARKPVLGNNDAIGIEQLTVWKMEDDGGAIRFLTNEDPIAKGMSNGQRLAADKIPGASTVDQRRTATNVTTAGLTLLGTVWNPSYATWTPEELAEIKFAYAPFQSSAVLNFLNDGGFVRVVTQVEFPLQVGFFALLGALDNPARGFHKIKTVRSTTDFTLDKAWDAGLATIDKTRCELAVMPKNRRHPQTVDFWGTTEGYALAAIDCDGVYATGRFKGGSGFFCDSANAKIYIIGNEGGAAGEIELNDPDTHGIYVAGARCTVFGMSSKSNGTSLTVNLRKQSDLFTAYSMELVGDGRCLYEQINGAATLFHPSVRGTNQTVLLNNIGFLMIVGGELTPDMIDASNTLEDKERVHFIQPRGASSSANSRIMQFTSNSFEFQTNEGGTFTDLMVLDSATATFSKPIVAPNIPSTYTASTVGTTAQALSLTGTQASGTASGYSIDDNYVARHVRISVTAQRQSTSRECATWIIDALMSRSANSGSTQIKAAGSLTAVPPTLYYDNSGTDPSTWAITVGLVASSPANLYIDAVGNLGSNINWSASISTVSEATYQ